MPNFSNGFSLFFSFLVLDIA